MTTKEARELFLIMNALSSRMRELEAAGNFSESGECHDLWLGLEEQWDALPANVRRAAAQGRARANPDAISVGDTVRYVGKTNRKAGLVRGMTGRVTSVSGSSVKFIDDGDGEEVRINREDAARR